MNDSSPSTNDDSTSTSLLDLIREGDDQGWRCLTELYGPLIYAWCRGSRLGPEDSADIMQDVFRAVVLHIGNFEKVASGSFRGWLWSITRNKVRDLHKVRAGKVRASGGSDGHEILQMQPAEEITGILDSTCVSGEQMLAHQALRIIKSEVKETTFTAFWRSTIDGIPPAVVADQLQIPVHSVWQARSRILRRARQLLENELGVSGAIVSTDSD
ncbi:RNA polymerase sigma factor [Stieleria varia]|uniref:RNA polymerase sigma factor n=1 Tax=Stieleria varia TaxID=2528005 RepID=A0A5C6A276_9BACT|nr:sigma-70 family RNA polymerase sigma factor [Stieleria varia]TWT93964.1 RNA polymerase sigma factor [Stieleria varia]